MSIKKRAWGGGGETERKDKPKGVKVKGKTVEGNLVDLDWHIQDHCLEL